jgi:hypothetical protein
MGRKSRGWNPPAETKKPLLEGLFLLEKQDIKFGSGNEVRTPDLNLGKNTGSPYLI